MRLDTDFPTRPARRQGIPAAYLLAGGALFMTLFTNAAFYRQVIHTYGLSWATAPKLLALACLLGGLTTLLLLLIPGRRFLKATLSMLFMVAAGAAYFMDTFGVIIDPVMLTNVAATDRGEVRDLLTPRLFIYMALLGLLPAIVAWRLPLRREPLRRGMRRRVVTGAVALGVVVVAVASSTAFFASFIREHKPLRYYTNPLTPIYATVRWASDRAGNEASALVTVGADAHIPPHPDRELVVLVVGETARADRFSLNGYGRDTNPELAARNVISFRDVSACGTSTAVSVPCMFALNRREDFDLDQAKYTENALDVLARAGVSVIWRDNNSDSKGVAERVPMEDYRSPVQNPDCRDECRDTGMLDGLQAFIDDHPDGDVLVVLHQMGSHGPAYFKRYDADQAAFQPDCRESQLDRCTRDQISNAYDNTIRSTDQFLARVIDLLAANDETFETVMMYVGDHGESLGEHGVYLHGLPYWLAPEAQTRVPMIFWLGRTYDDADPDALVRLRDRPMSHDNLFHTLLGVFEVESSIYDPSLDILALSRHET